MTNEHSNQKMPPQTPQRPLAKLDYAIHIGAYPSPRLQPHPWFAVLLIGLAILAALWSITLGTMSLGDLTILGWGLIGAGVLLFWGSFGKLSARRLRPKAALLFLLASLAIYIPVIVMSHLNYVRQQTRYARDLETLHSSFGQMPTYAESQVYTFSMIRDTAAVSSLLGAGCCTYALTRLMRRRGDDLA
jgi:hypothetical protein